MSRVLRGRGTETFQPRVEIGQARLEIGELVAQLLAQRRQPLRQIGQRAAAQLAALGRGLDLVERGTDRIDADQRRLLGGGE